MSDEIVSTSESDEVPPNGIDSSVPVVDDPVIDDPAVSDSANGGGTTSARSDHVAPQTFIPLRFVDVVMVLPSTHPVVILEETQLPHRQLRIPIGSTEGIAIAYAARGIDTPKPLTHELFVDTLQAFGITIEVVRLIAVQGSSYSAEIIFSSTSGQRALRCRPSDAIALAIRQGLAAPITAAPDVLDQVGFTTSPES